VEDECAGESGGDGEETGDGNGDRMVGRQLEVAMGIGWLPQIRKTWPALGHQQSLEPQKWPRPKMGGEKRK